MASPRSPSRTDALEALGQVSSNPARRRVQPAHPVHPWKRDAAWAQVKLSAAEFGAGPSAPQPSDGVKVPRASQPLRVEPPPEYNAPARAQRPMRSSSP